MSPLLLSGRLENVNNLKSPEESPEDIRRHMKTSSYGRIQAKTDWMSHCDSSDPRTEVL